ncbi:MAG: type II toxin-antitoxin system RelE/ParE family toxin [Verrucomicrobia bacterium]|nr:type II toxin-antitoxin system RelE/ParE family toxin [Verrucomicrobiota bacterium]
MKKRAIFHPEAEAEFLAALTYYADRSSRVAERFDAEIQRLVAQIETIPHRHGPWRHGTRRARARKFPFIIIFAERPKALFIVAIAHTKKHPDYWTERLS